MSFFKKLSRGVKKAGTSIVKSKLVKMGVAGLAVVYPPVGVPAAAALAVADKVLTAAKSPDKAISGTAAKLVASTALLAKKGDVDAQRGLALLLKRKRELAAGTGPSPQAVKAANARLQAQSRAGAAVRPPGRSAARPAAPQARTGTRFSNAWVVTSQGRVAFGRNVTV